MAAIRRAVDSLRMETGLDGPPHAISIGLMVITVIIDQNQIRRLHPRISISALPPVVRLLERRWDSLPVPDGRLEVNGGSIACAVDLVWRGIIKMAYVAIVPTMTGMRWGVGWNPNRRYRRSARALLYCVLSVIKIAPDV